jgi:glutathione S-transferase
VALFLEEAGLPHELVPVDTRKGERFAPPFLAINPDAKTPAIVDGDGTVFDGNAILLYLAEKTGRFLPEDTPAARGQLPSWLMFVATGVGPYPGQAVHFQHHAPAKLDYAVNRYLYEALRHWGIPADARTATPSSKRWTRRRAAPCSATRPHPAPPERGRGPALRKRRHETGQVSSRHAASQNIHS